MSAPKPSQSLRQTGSAVLTLGLLAVVVALGTWTEFAADFDRDGIGLYFLESLFVFVPVGAGLLAGQMARLDMTALAVATLACTALMVGQDLLPPSELTATKRELAYVPLSNEWAVADARDIVRWPEGGSFALVFDYVSGDLPAADSVDTAYPDESPRIQVGWALHKFGYLLAPFIAVGFVVGLRVWVMRNVRFRTRGSERAFAFALSWVVGPALPLSLMWVQGRAVQLGVAELGLHTILVPPLVFAALAALGWRAGFRSVRLAADLDAVPGEE